VTVAARRTERLLNLVICLLSTRRYLSKEEIRRSVEGYSEGQEAFERAFERDKEELRELGIPLEIGSNDPLFDDETGYRIRRDAYELPPISLSPDEMAVMGLAARFWQQASLAEASSRALLKLKAQHPGDTAGADLLGIEPRLVRDEPGFEGLWKAVRERRAVEFDYRTRDGSQSRRHLEPWGMVAWHGRWYAVGHDRDRDDVRVFRVGRITSQVEPTGPPGAVDVPADVDLRGMVHSLEASNPPSTAQIRVADGTGGGLRRQALGEPGPDPAHEGWVLLEVPFRDLAALVDDVVGYGPNAVVVGPPEARRAARDRLLGAIAARGATP